ncbi:hypothetical protein [Elizabethkingia ursingii]|uniref:hypothetical protein n=1 Tax=Elizabethkingia ursingii TaxID=1756150 RepID=UPI002010FE04|nr:hypothetical protein [Elizabethkingia ursingii]MCL1671522.1 hypothetical protein [Elizabethkingia ursingii]
MRIKQNIISIFLFLAIGSINVKAQTTTNVSQDKAYELHENRLFAEVPEMYEELLKTDYKNAYLLGMCGSSYFALEKYEKAKEKYSLAILYMSPDDKKRKHCSRWDDRRQKLVEKAMKACE